MRQPVQFGKYLLLDRISVGGMAEVFKAKSFGVEGFEKVIAIKRILPSMGEDEDFISMFIDEAKIAGQLAHANIGQIHELGEVDGAHFIAMEYIQGRDLLQLQKRFRKLDKKIPVEAACFIVMKICEGLHYAHKKRDVLGVNLDIVHRDCSPQNVVISYEGEVKLIDFGIARAASRSSRTQAGVLKGKFAYMSPEQVRGLPLDRRSDIFSIGTILFECLTGERLFNAESDFSTLERVRNAEFDRNALKEAGVPPAVEAIVFKALERSTEDRYQWCSEFGDDLKSFLQSVDNVYTSRSLGQDIRSVFAKELQRDRELMDSYASISMTDGAEIEPDLEIFVEGTGEARPRSRSPQAESKAGSLASGSQPRRTAQDDEGDFDDGATAVFGEVGMAELLREMGVNKKAAATEDDKPKPASDTPNVEVAGQKSPPPLPDAASRASTRLGVPAPSNADQQVSEQAPRYSPPIPTPQPEPGSATPYPPLQRVSTDSFGAGLAFTTRRASTVLKESGPTGKILIGVAVAVLAGLIYFGVKTFVLNGGGDKIVANTATLVVMVGDKQVADVFLDGKDIGPIEAGEDLTVDDLEPGKHEVRVEREGAASCTDTVTVTSQRIKYYNCEFAAKKEASLLFEGLLEGDSVVVDGKEVETGGLEEALPLHTGRVHTVAISRQGKIIDEFSVTLKAGEERRHKVPAEGETPGADDGEPVETPPPADPVPEPVLPEPVLPETVVPETGSSANKPPVQRPIPKPRVVEPEPEPVPVVTDTHGYLTAATKPWARIYIDGKDTGKQTPVTAGGKIKLKPGIHQVTFVADGKKHNYSITIRAGETKRMFKVLAP